MTVTDAVTAAENLDALADLMAEQSARLEQFLTDEIATARARLIEWDEQLAAAR